MGKQGLNLTEIYDSVVIWYVSNIIEWSGCFWQLNQEEASSVPWDSGRVTDNL